MLMGKRGPKPLPMVIKKLHGSQRGDYKIPAPPIGDDTIPTCPDWLSDRAKKKWFEVIQQLRRISESLLSSVDVQILARYCVIWELWDKARQFIEKYGEVIVLKNKKGRPKKIRVMPQANLLLKYGQELQRIENEFGMSPSSRTRVSGESKKPESESGKSRFFRFKGKDF
jgi:P27 family predicted phage terminase small subunit